LTSGADSSIVPLFRLIERRILVFLRLKPLVEKEIEDVSEVISISLSPSLVNRIAEAKNSLLETN